MAATTLMLFSTEKRGNVWSVHCTLSVKLYFSNKKDNGGLFFCKLNSPSGVYLKSSPSLSLSNLFPSLFPSLPPLHSVRLWDPYIVFAPSKVSLCGLVYRARGKGSCEPEKSHWEIDVREKQRLLHSASIQFSQLRPFYKI